jgi:hypothetical protein
MKVRMQVVSRRTPVNEEEWRLYFQGLASSVGFSKVVQEEGHSNVFVREHPDVPNGDLGTLVVGEEFIPRYAEVLKAHPAIFKKHLEHTVIHLAGEVFTAGMVYSGMEGLATIVGAEKLGYSPGEIVDLLAMEIVMGYLVSRGRGMEDYEAYLKSAESVYDVIFWDFLTKEEVQCIIAKAREIKGKLAGLAQIHAVREVKKKT